MSQFYFSCTDQTKFVICGLFHLNNLPIWFALLLPGFVAPQITELRLMRIRRSLQGNKIAKPTDQVIFPY